MSFDRHVMIADALRDKLRAQNKYNVSAERMISDVLSDICLEEQMTLLKRRYT